MGTSRPSSRSAFRGCSQAVKGGAGWSVAPDAAGELPLWRYLRQQQGFTEEGITRMQRSKVNGQRTTDAKIETDLAPSIALLRAEGLDTPAIQRLYEQLPDLLTTSHAVFSSALAALRQLVQQLPEDPLAVQAPLGATRLGVALFLFPSAAAELLTRRNLGSLLDNNVRLRRQLGMSDAEAALALLRNQAAMISDAQRAETMVAHLLGLQSSGALLADQGGCWLQLLPMPSRVPASTWRFPPDAAVRSLANSTPALRMTPAEFDQRWQECGGKPMLFGYADAATRQSAVAEAVGALLQAAAGEPGPLQAQYLQQGAAERCASLAKVGPHSIRANWAALRRIGLTDSQIVAAVRSEPSILTFNWEGDAKRRLAAWLRQELGVELAQFIHQHPSYTTSGVARMSMRAAYLRAHRPGVWEDYLARGTGPLLYLLSSSLVRFNKSASCAEEEVDEFNRAWLQMPDGRRWGRKPNVRNRRAAK